MKTSKNQSLFGKGLSVYYFLYHKWSYLSLYQTTNFRLFQNEEFADNNFKFDKNGRKLSKQVENTVGKGEIARYEQFLLFPQCFQKASFPEASKSVIVWEWVKPLPNNKFLNMTKLKAFADNKLIVAKITISLCDRAKNTGKRIKCWLPAFYSFPTVFSKAFFFTVLKSLDCVAKSKTL